MSHHTVVKTVIFITSTYTFIKTCCWVKCNLNTNKTGTLSFESCLIIAFISNHSAIVVQLIRHLPANTENMGSDSGTGCI